MKNNIVQVLKLIKKDIFNSILILFQLTIILLLTYSIIINTIEFNEKNSKFKMLWSNRNIISLTYQGDIMGIEKSNIEQEKIKELKNYLYSLKLECNSFHGGQIYIDNFSGIDKVKYYNKMLDGDPILNDKAKSLIETLAISENFIKEFNLKLNSGRWFSKEEYKNNAIGNENNNIVIPVVLGSSFKEFFKIGDIINNTDSYQMEIIGFIDRNQYFSSSNLFFYPSKITSLDTFIITPYNTPNFSKNHDVFDSVWKINSDEKYEDVIQKLELKIKDLNLDAKVEEYQKYINIYKDNYNQIKNLLIVQQSLLTLIVIVGINIILMLFINKHKQSFSIHIAYGATYNNILTRIWIFPIIILLVSILIDVCLLKFNIIGNLVGLHLINNSKIINYNAFCISIFIMFIIILLSTILPIYKIKNESLNKIMKGD